MENQQPPLLNTTDPCETLKIVYNANDDTLTRLYPIPCIAAADDHHNPHIITKDICLNTTHKTWLRLFIPTEPRPSPNSLPLIIYFHGGGFVLCSAANTLFHDFCARIAADLPAVVASVEYRLAPERRLPAAYEDAVEAVNWVREHGIKEKWTTDFVDFSKCYLMGNSSGGNIAYRAGLGCGSLDLEPVKIVGLVLIQPYFGGVERSESEMRLANDGHFPLVVNDLMWELALPRGADRDHEYCNPMVAGAQWEKIGKCFVSVRGGDPVMDRQIALARRLEGEGVKVETWFEEEGYHGIELFDPVKASELLLKLKHFICSPEAAE